jgi:hypothetical protein
MGKKKSACSIRNDGVAKQIDLPADPLSVEVRRAMSTEMPIWMAYEVMCSVTDSSKALTPFQTICAPIQTRRNDESFIITDIPV